MKIFLIIKIIYFLIDVFSIKLLYGKINFLSVLFSALTVSFSIILLLFISFQQYIKKVNTFDLLEWMYNLNKVLMIVLSTFTDILILKAIN